MLYSGRKKGGRSMLYLIYNTVLQRYVFISTKANNYAWVEKPDAATAMPWDQAVEYYRKHVSEKRRKECVVIFQDPARRGESYRPRLGDREPGAAAAGTGRIYFLIDYENVHDIGLEGVEYLTAEDSVTLFYSESAPNMKRRRFKAITDSGCEFDVCRLNSVGKNALDFYIVSKIGEIFGNGRPGTACVISGDAGFEAAADYWARYAREARAVFRAPTVESGILLLDSGSERAAQIREMSGKVDIATEFARFDERRKFRRQLEELLRSVGCADRLDDTEALLNRTREKKVIYLSALHLFGRQKGLEMYSRLKELGLA